MAAAVGAELGLALLDPSALAPPALSGVATVTIVVGTALAPAVSFFTGVSGAVAAPGSPTPRPRPTRRRTSPILSAPSLSLPSLSEGGADDATSLLLSERTLPSGELARAVSSLRTDDGPVRCAREIALCGSLRRDGVDDGLGAATGAGTGTLVVISLRAAAVLDLSLAGDAADGVLKRSESCLREGRRALLGDEPTAELLREALLGSATTRGAAAYRVGVLVPECAAGLLPGRARCKELLPAVAAAGGAAGVLVSLELVVVIMALCGLEGVRTSNK